MAALLMVAACTQKAPQNGALIQGWATGLDSDDIITAELFQHEGGVGVGIGTDTLRNGRFTFRLDSLSEADHYMVSLFRPRDGYVDVINYGPEIYLDPTGSSGSVRAYGTTGIPTFVLVSPEGMINQIIVGYGEGRLRRAVQNAIE